MIRKELFKPTTAHVLMLSFLLGGMGVFFLGLQESLKKMEDNIRPSLKVIVFFQPALSEDDAKTWVSGLPAQDTALESVAYISRQEALERAQGNPALVKSLLLLRDNPLPATALLHFKDIAWLERPEPAISLRASPEVQELRWDPEARTSFRSVRQWRMWLARVSLVLVILMSAWCGLGLYHFWAARARRGELLVQLGLGLLGGGLSVLIFGLALRGLGADAAPYAPPLISPWPILAALMASLATFGWKVNDAP